MSYTQVTRETLYTEEDGYGWLSNTSLDSRSRTAGGDRRRDFVFSNTAAVFQTNLENGTYAVTCSFGDAEYVSYKMRVKANGVSQFSNISAALDWQERTFFVTVTDGLLSLEISDDGGANNNWRLNSVEIVSA